MGNISDFTKLDSENYHSYIWRLDQLIQSGKYKNWKEITPMVNKELFGDDESQYRDESAFRKACKYAKDFKEAGVFNSDDEYIQELQVQRRELEKAKKQIQTEKLEYNKWLREEARDELITEKICDAITTLPPLDIPKYIKPVHNNRSYLFVFGDSHFGISYQIKDLFGNIINEYSPEIFYERMNNLLSQLIETIHKEDITELEVWELGDGIQGIIRLNSQLMKLRYGIIDSTIKYSIYLSNWLSVLAEHTRVKFQMVEDSNHNQLRICSAPKNAFTEENMSKVMSCIIKERLKDNPNFVFIENPTGMNYSLMSTYQVLGCHGEMKNFTNAVKDFSTALGTPLDYVIGAHIHHNKSEGNGISSAALSIPSICGTDPYGMSLNKVSNAGATLFTFEIAKGKVAENNYILD